MKKLIVLIALFCFPIAVLAHEGDAELEKAEINLQDKVSLQRGAQIFFNNCLGCHSAKYVRYERIANDLNIPKEVVLDKLVFDKDKKFGDQLTIAMTKEYAAKQFGTAPPDLTLEARSRGADWLFSYLIGFEPDDKRPWGVNNKVFKDVGMPFVLANMERDLGPEKFKEAMQDLTAFMVYMAEPVRLEREHLGAYVLGFLLLLLIPVWFLNKEYWKDVH